MSSDEVDKVVVVMGASDAELSFTEGEDRSLLAHPDKIDTANSIVAIKRDLDDRGRIIGRLTLHPVR